MIESKNMTQLLFFAVIAIISYGVFEAYFSGDDKPLFQPFTKGYAITGVTIESTNEQGEIISTIQSPAVIHYADTEKTLIEQPNVTLHNPDGDWVFQSQVGEVNAQQTEIYFPDEVLVYYEQEAVNSPLKINTSSLTVDFINKIGETAARLQVAQPGSLMKGLGAVVDFNQQEIEILDEMYAEIEN